MIYPDEYKCLTCKFQNYGCGKQSERRSKTGRLLGCSRYIPDNRGPFVIDKRLIAVFRCLFGVCPQKLKVKVKENGIS